MKYAIISDAHGNRPYFGACMLVVDELKIDAAQDKLYRLQEERRNWQDRDKAFLTGLMSDWETDSHGQKLLFVHEAPFDSLNGYLYEDNKDYLWDGQGYRFIFMGHTHRPYIKRSGEAIFVNVGSCGLPRDIGMSPSLCIFDDTNMTAEIIRIQMPQEILASGYYCGLDDRVLEVLWRR